MKIRFSRRIRKRTFVPVIVCLVCLAVLVIYTHYTYKQRVTSKVQLISSFSHSIIREMDNAIATARAMTLTVKTLITPEGIMDTPERYPAIVAALESLFDLYPFVASISIYDQHGDAFNMSRDTDGHFLTDRYQARVVVLRSKEEVTEERGIYYYVLPLLEGEKLLGNVAVQLNIFDMQKRLYSPFAEMGNLWVTSASSFDHGSVTFPRSEVSRLSNINELIELMQQGQKGVISGNINYDGHSIPVVTVYQRLPYAGQFFGLALSYNISKIRASSLVFFITLSILLIIFTIAVIITLHLLLDRLMKKTVEQQGKIDLMDGLFRKMPVSLLLTEEGKPLLANETALQTFASANSFANAGLSAADIAFPASVLSPVEGDEWELVTLEEGSEETYLLKKQVQLTLGSRHLIVTVMPNITEKEQGIHRVIRSEKAKAEIIGRISSDFKHLIDDIKEATALLVQNYPKDATPAHVMETVDVLMAKVADVQDFSNIEAGKLIPDEAPFNLSEEVEAEVARFMPDTQRKGIKLRTEVAPATERLLVGDAVRLRQVIYQLVSNAVKFTDKGKVVISLSTSPFDPDNVLIQCAIEDTGRGMSKNQLKTLFSPNKDGAIGLGTFIAKRVIDIMGGNLLVSSPSSISTDEERPGCCFSFTIPCHLDKHYDKKLDFSAITDYSQLGILVIAEESQNVRYRVDYLQKKGIRPDVFVYSRTNKALLVNKLKVDKDRYQMVVIEMRDGQGGFEAASKLMESGQVREHLFVMVAPYEQRGNYLRAKNLMMDYYIIGETDFTRFDSIIDAHFPHLDAVTVKNLEIERDLKVLIAENNSLSLMVTTLVFRKIGYQVNVVRNMSELEAKIAEQTYDILFVDLKFPPTDGFDVVKTLRNKGFNFPVIAMTSTLTAENIRKIADCGMNGHVSKPLQIEEVKAILYKCLV